MRLLAPPPRGAITPEVQAGEQVFQRIGCAGCHVPTWTTGSSPIAALGGVTFHPYSDFLLHDMGALGDGIEQGRARGTEMRTMPLWGLRMRQMFLHDGRTRSLADAIGAHAGQGQRPRSSFISSVALTCSCSSSFSSRYSGTPSGVRPSLMRCGRSRAAKALPTGYSSPPLIRVRSTLSGGAVWEC